MQDQQQYPHPDIEDIQGKNTNSHAANLGTAIMAAGIVLCIYIMLYTCRSWGRPVYPPDVARPSMDYQSTS